MLLGPHALAPTLGSLAQVDTSQPITASELTGRYQVILFHVGPHHEVATQLIRNFSAALAAFQVGCPTNFRFT